MIAELAAAGIAVADTDVLDLGAGLGGISEELIIRGARVTALEPSAAWASVTKLRVGRHGGVFRLLEAFGESIPLPDGAVDLVISLQVLEHVRDPTKVLAEIWRVLRPGGHFYLACENYLTFYEPHYRVPWLPLAEIPCCDISAHPPPPTAIPERSGYLCHLPRSAPYMRAP